MRVARSVGAQDEIFYLVKGSALPEVLVKVLEAKDLLQKGKVKTVQEAVHRVRLSRSAFYKYRDGVFPLEQGVEGKVVTVSLHLEHRSGVLSKVLGTMARAKANVRTISQSAPVQGVAEVTVAFETAGMQSGLHGLLNQLARIEGVRTAAMVSQS